MCGSWAGVIHRTSRKPHYCTLSSCSYLQFKDTRTQDGWVRLAVMLEGQESRHLGFCLARGKRTYEDLPKLLFYHLVLEISGIITKDLTRLDFLPLYNAYISSFPLFARHLVWGWLHDTGFLPHCKCSHVLKKFTRSCFLHILLLNDSHLFPRLRLRNDSIVTTITTVQTVCKCKARYDW